MPMIQFPLGGFDLDYNSKQSRAEVINGYMEGEQEFISVRRTEGLEEWIDCEEPRIRSDLILVDGLIYFVAGESLYQVDRLKNLVNLGTVGGSGRCVLAANNIPDDSQILVLNGLGQALVYQPSVGLAAVTDSNYEAASYVTVLNERFWFPKDNSNQFFASAVSDGTFYPSTAIASAEESPDNVMAPLALKSALWVIGTKTTEYWQSINDSSLPVRQVKGASYERGCAAVNSIVRTGDTACFLADDKTVRMLSGNQMVEVSTLAFTLEVRGDGSLRNPGYSKIDDAYAFYVDGPVHKVYYLTFPTEGVTWGFDLAQGVWHKCKSDGMGKWRVSGAVSAYDQVIVADSESGKLYTMSYGSRTEDGSQMTFELTTPSLSWQKDVVIPMIEIDMETGVGLTDGQGEDPLMMVEYTKDGGLTWVEHSSVNLGRLGQYNTRVPMYQFGRVIRNQDFALRLRVSDPVEVRMYRAWITLEEGM